MILVEPKEGRLLRADRWTLEQTANLRFLDLNLLASSNQDWTRFGSTPSVPGQRLSVRASCFRNKDER